MDDSKGTLTRYLLGELSDRERDSFEERYFSDPQLFDTLAQVESDLIDDYVRDRLAPDVRQQFESFYLVAPERLERVKFAEALVARVDGEQSSADEVRQPSKTRQPSWASTVATSKLAIGLATAALLILSIAIWFAIDGRRTRPEAVQTDTTKTDHDREASDRRAAEPQPSPVDAAPRGQPGNRVPPTIVALSLVVGPGERSILPSAPATLAIPRGTQEVRLELQMQERDAAPYTVIVRAIGGSQIVRRTGLVAAASGPAFSLTVPASQFAPGDYMLTLQGTTRGGDTEDLSQTLFRVQR